MEPQRGPYFGRGEIMDSFSAALAKQEILAWWSTERARVDRDCRDAAENYRQIAGKSVDELTLMELIRGGEKRKAVEEQLRSRMNVFNRRMERSLQETCVASISRIEGVEFEHSLLSEAAVLAGTGVTAAGSLGLAVVATGVATTTTVTTVLGIFSTGTVVTFSWPVFAVAAVGATALAVVSTRMQGYAAERLKANLKEKIGRSIEAALVGDNNKGETKSTRQSLLELLDEARDIRVRAIGTWQEPE